MKVWRGQMAPYLPEYNSSLSMRLRGAHREESLRGSFLYCRFTLFSGCFNTFTGAFRVAAVTISNAWILPFPTSGVQLYYSGISFGLTWPFWLCYFKKYICSFISKKRH